MNVWSEFEHEHQPVTPTPSTCEHVHHPCLYESEVAGLELILFRIDVLNVGGDL
jgi:hypothetical protein